VRISLVDGRNLECQSALCVMSPNLMSACLLGPACTSGRGSKVLLERLRTLHLSILSRFLLSALVGCTLHLSEPAVVLVSALVSSGEEGEV
jgi:hypothetical protein